MLAFCLVDRRLHFLLHHRNLVRIADDFHPLGGIVDEGVERHQRQDRFGAWAEVVFSILSRLP